MVLKILNSFSLGNSRLFDDVDRFLTRPEEPHFGTVPAVLEVTATPSSSSRVATPDQAGGFGTSACLCVHPPQDHVPGDIALKVLLVGMTPRKILC